MSNDLKNTIFLSYRRKDTASATGRLHDYLEKEFGAEMVFKDIHDIGLGTDFRKEIGKTLMNCKVVLVLIGDRYVSLTDAQGNIRIMNPNDYVNIEVSTALAFKDQKLVIPILVNGARMPGRDQLPKNLEAITWQNSKKLSNDYWQTDVERLIKSIRAYLQLPEVKERTTAPPVQKFVQKTVRKTVAPPPKKSSNSGVFKGIALGVLGLFILLIGVGIGLTPDATTTATKTTAKAYPSFKGFVDATKLNVRSEPGTSGTDIITQLKQNNVVSVIDEKKHAGKSWYKVNTNGKEGWVSSDYISTSMIDEPLKKDQIQLSQAEKPTRLAATPTTPAIRPQDQPVTTYTYQQLAIGSWNLTRVSSDGESVTVPEFMTMMSGGLMDIQNASMTYNLNGSTNLVTTYVEGLQETMTHNYQINGNIFTMGTGIVGNIDLLTQRQFVYTANIPTEYGSERVTFHFVRI